MVKKISDLLNSVFEKDSTLKIVSIILAIIIWAIVSITQYPTITKPFYNVPVEISLEDTYAQSNQLSVISLSDETVNITLSGERREIGDLKAEDLKAVVDVSNVMQAKDYRLTMNIVSASDPSRILSVESIEPSTVEVTFDKIVSKEFEVTPMTEHIRIIQGYLSGDPVVTPQTVTVTGPEDTVNSITRVCARVTAEAELSSTYEFNTDELVLYNENAVIYNEDELLTFDKNSFAVQIPVFVRQTLPLEVNIINAPDNFDVEHFKEQLVFSVEALDIAAPNDKIRELTALNIGTINMREVDIGSQFEFRTENFLPGDYENLSQTETVTVTCPSEGISKKTVTIRGRDIQFINRPIQFDFTSIASGMSLHLVGDEEQIAELSSMDITAQIDLIDFDMQEGELSMPVNFIISSYDRVWFNGGDSTAAPKIVVRAEFSDPGSDQ